MLIKLFKQCAARTKKVGRSKKLKSSVNIIVHSICISGRRFLDIREGDGCEELTSALEAVLPRHAPSPRAVAEL
jgi:hypothetical protein